MPVIESIVADWPAPAHVHTLCTTRGGLGASAPPYDRLNLGDHVGDDAQAVAVNRQQLARVLGARPVFLRQVHGTQVVRLHADTPDSTQADGCLTTAPGLACTIMVADCLPVLLTDAAGTVVAAAHAGWRSLAGQPQPQMGVLERLVQDMRAVLGEHAGAQAQAAPLLAWLGPCIGPAVFEVGSEVRAAFMDFDARAKACFAPHKPGKWLADLPALARQRLGALGVAHVSGNDGSASWCTASDRQRYFSHRRDGVTGRMAACIWLTRA